MTHGDFIVYYLAQVRNLLVIANFILSFISHV